MIDPCDKEQNKHQHLNQRNNAENLQSSSKELQNKNSEKRSVFPKKHHQKHSKKQRQSGTSKSSDSDEEINKAYEKSVKDQSLLPILKHELRLKIQTRRLSEGQGELLPEREEPKVYELTEEEKEKYKRRLEQNRESLRRSRQKEIAHEEMLKQTFDTESSKSESLKRQKRELLTVKEDLLKKLRQTGMDFNENTSIFTCKRCKQTIKCPMR